MLPPRPDRIIDADTPLARLATLQRALGAGAERLRALASPSLADTERQQLASAACRLFDELAPRLHALEREHVHVALIESMAGSDPVCLRDITAAMDDGYRQLQRQWHALRTPVFRACDGHLGALDAALLHEFAAGWHARLAREQNELLPMAERLLDEQALAAIGEALDRLGWVADRATPGG